MPKPDPEEAIVTDPPRSAFSFSTMRRLYDGILCSYAMWYRDEGRLGELILSDGRVIGTVEGLVRHTAQLWVEDGEPGWSCTCPIAVDELLCAHCVAVLDAYESQSVVPEEPDDAEEYLQQEASLREYLRTLDTETLVEIVLDQTRHGDWVLSERLNARAASAANSTIDLADWRDRLDRAFNTGDYLDADRMAQWAHEVHRVIEALDELTDLGQAVAVAELYEYAAGLLDRAGDHVDDRLNWLEGPRRLIGQFHHRACQETRPDPIALAGRLVELELRFPLGVFCQSAARYASLLGAEGLAEYQRLLELRRDALRSGAGASEDERTALRKAVVGTALASGDPDRLIEAKSYDLHTPEDFSEVAGMLADAGRVDEAVGWVERGLAAFAGLPLGDQTVDLYDLLVSLHRRRGDAARTAEALWGRFAAVPSLYAYHRLLREPEIAGDVDAWRARVMEHLSERSPFDVIAGISVLPEILAYEGDFDEAWAVAQRDGCDRRLRFLMARGRERSHPEDAIRVYEEETEAWIATQKGSGYRHAVRLMTSIERVYRMLGRSEDFIAYVERVRREHLHKPAFFELLWEQGWRPDPFRPAADAVPPPLGRLGPDLDGVGAAGDGDVYQPPTGPARQT